MNYQLDTSNLPSLINDRYLPLINNQNRFLVLYGGAGSGKSIFAYQKILYRIITEGNHKVIITRKVGSTLRNSCYSEFNNIIKQFGVESFAKKYVSDLHIEFEAFNSSVHFLGMDDPEKIKSFAGGLTIIYMEELTEFDEDDLSQLNLRLRGISDNYKQIMACFNPISKEHWVKKYFIDDFDGDSMTVVHCTYKDNQFLDKAYILELENRYKNNPLYYQVYVLGKFGNVAKGGEFFYNLAPNYNRVVEKQNYSFAKPLFLSFDFNILPYSSVLVGQMLSPTHLYVFESFAVKPPYNRPADQMKIFMGKYFNFPNYIITGDAAGNQSSSLVEDGVNAYSQIWNAWSEKGRPTVALKKAVPSKNPSIIRSADFINELFAGGITNADGEVLKVSIRDNCDALIDDLSDVKTAADQTMLKQRVKDKKTGATYEKNGHMSDTFRYLICTAFKAEYETFINRDRPNKQFAVSFTNSNYRLNTY